MTPVDATITSFCQHRERLRQDCTFSQPFHSRQGYRHLHCLNLRQQPEPYRFQGVFSNIYSVGLYKVLCKDSRTVANLVAVNERKVFFSCVRCFDSGTNSVGCKALCGSDRAVFNILDFHRYSPLKCRRNNYQTCFSSSPKMMFIF